MKIERHTISSEEPTTNLLTLPEKVLVINKITGLVYYIFSNMNSKVILLGFNEHDLGQKYTYTKEEAEKATVFGIFDKELRIRNS